MFKRFRLYYLILLALPLVLGQSTFLAMANPPLKAAFIREGNLWMKEEDKETQLTFQGVVESPSWSPDGKWIAFSKRKSPSSDSEIWVYNVQSKRSFQAFHHGDHPKWAPHQNILAFQDRTVLDIIDFTGGVQHPFQNVALGVDQYNWLPDGTGFMATSQANLLPDGWTRPIIYKIGLPKRSNNTDLYNQATRFYILPSTIKKGNTDILSIGVSQYKWSSDGKWISFKVNPTASWSMDSNMLCVLSADGKTFTPLAELASGFGYDWAPTENLLGYIQGGGRIVSGFTNKQLHVTKFPSLRSQLLTPRHYVDLAFAWLNDQSLYVSRVPEQAWSASFSKRALPILYRVDFHSDTPRQVSFPPSGFGDFDPIFLRKTQILTWTRSNWDKRDVWISRPDGTSPIRWIENIDLISWY